MPILISKSVARALRAAEISTRAQMIARAAEFEALGIAPRDAEELRARLGLLARTVMDDAAPAAGTANARGADPLAELPALLTTTEAAEFLRWNRRTMANKCLDGTVRALRLGDDWRIPRGEIARLLASAETGADASAKEA